MRKRNIMYTDALLYMVVGILARMHVHENTSDAVYNVQPTSGTEGAHTHIYLIRNSLDLNYMKHTLALTRKLTVNALPCHAVARELCGGQAVDGRLAVEGQRVH